MMKLLTILWNLLLNRQLEKRSTRAKDEHISLDAIKFWYTAMLSRYNSTNAANNSLDTKVGVLLAAIIALMAIMLQSDNQSNFVITAYFIYSICILLCFRTLFVRDVNTEVHTSKEKEAYYALRDEEFYWQLVADLEDAIEKNERVNKFKSYMWVATLVLWIFGTFLALLGYQV